MIEMDEYKQIFDSDPSIVAIEIGTYRIARALVPDKFDSNLKCKPDTITVYANELPLLHYVDRQLVEHSVTDISYMFANCSNLVTVECGSWNTSQVTNMSYLFHGCKKLKFLDVSSWDTSKVTNMSHMFYGCLKISSIKCGKWNVQRVTNMNSMFKHCRQLLNLCLKWQASSLFHCSSMFNDCRLLQKVNVSGFQMDNVKRIHKMFHNCFSLSDIDFSCWNVDNMLDISSLCSNCYHLVNVKLPLDMQTIKNAEYMFYNCWSINSIDCNNLKASKLKYAFGYCLKLTIVDITIPDDADSECIFENCTKLIR